MAQLTLSLLGGFAASYEGETLSKFRSAKIRALLAYLAVESDRPHARDQLADLLWPEMSNSDARRNLRNSLSRLRRSIGVARSERMLVSTRQEVHLDGRYLLVDANRFQQLLDKVEEHGERQRVCPQCAGRLAEAVALYQGEFLAGFFLADAPGFDEWALWRREAYHEQLLQALHKLVVYHEAGGRYKVAQSYAARQVVLEPWREGAHRQLMRLLATMGERGAALTQYERARRVLRAELDVDPTQETVALYEAIRDNRLPGPKEPAAPVVRNLPRPFTTFVGREREVAEVGQRLANPACALLTLIGPGGSGKTRLALEVARRRASHYRDGVWLVSLAPVAAAEDVPAAVAAALSIPLSGALPAATEVGNYLQAKEALLVVDNVEHVPGAAPFLLALLQKAERLTLLATSRQPLHLRAEWLFAVDGLAVARGGDAGAASEAPAGRLLVERMQQRFLHYKPTEAEAAAVGRLCGLLEGMPLAIELAAAQAEPGRIGELERAVAADLDVLATTMRDVPPRQRSLRAMFKYAWALLPAEEKRALAGVSVIQHPFSAEAGQEIAECTAMALEGLAEKSLLHAAEPGQYALHEVVRQYALEALEQTARGADATQDRHSAYFLGMLARWEGALTGPAQGQRLAEMEAVVDDVRAAWKWAVATAKMDQLVEAEGALFHFYNRRSHFREGARQFARAAETARVEGECPLALAAFLGREAYFRRRLGEQGAALCLAKESAELTREGTGGNAVEAFALGVLASVKSQRGNHDQARRLLEGALALYQKAGDEAGLAATLNALGTVASHTGAYEQALGYYEACLARQEAVEDREMMAACYNNMGVAYYHLAEPAKTEVLFAQSLAIRAEIGDKQGEAKLRNNLGVIAMKQGKLEEAAAYLEASRAAHTALGVERGVALSLLHLGELALVREEPVRAGKLLKEAMARARATGATTVMLEVVVALGQLAEQTGDAARAVALLSLAATDSQAKAETRAAALAALAEVEARLSAAARRAAREQGARLTLAEVATGKE